MEYETEDAIIAFSNNEPNKFKNIVDSMLQQKALDIIDAKRIEVGSNMFYESENIEETVTRKHFQQVADAIKSHPDPAKRKELADHHASIFKTQNPRFDHGRFKKACGVN